MVSSCGGVTRKWAVEFKIELRGHRGQIYQLNPGRQDGHPSVSTGSGPEQQLDLSGVARRRFRGRLIFRAGSLTCLFWCLKVTRGVRCQMLLTGWIQDEIRGSEVLRWWWWWWWWEERWGWPNRVLLGTLLQDALHPTLVLGAELRGAMSPVMILTASPKEFLRVRPVAAHLLHPLGHLTITLCLVRRSRCWILFILQPQRDTSVEVWSL